jgi:hypothetical protein
VRKEGRAISATQALGRRRRVPRPVAVLAAAVVGLGALVGGVGAVLGGTGSAAATHEAGHLHDGFDGPGDGPGRAQPPSLEGTVTMPARTGGTAGPGRGVIAGIGA